MTLTDVENKMDKLGLDTNKRSYIEQYVNKYTTLDGNLNNFIDDVSKVGINERVMDICISLFAWTGLIMIGVLLCCGVMIAFSIESALSGFIFNFISSMFFGFLIYCVGFF